MGLKELELKSVYKSNEDDVLMDFYVPCLSVATSYDRLAGFFSSTSFAVSAEGLLSFVQHGGHMRLICSPEFQAGDIDVLRSAPNRIIEQTANRMRQSMDGAETIELQHDHLAVLATMLFRSLLEIRVAIPDDQSNIPLSELQARSSGIFHEKVGILTDSDGCVVSFSGSINESATAWIENSEDFKVFRGWEPGQRAYQQPDIDHFTSLWEGKARGIRVMTLPEAVRLDMLRRAVDEPTLANLRAKYQQRRAARVRDLPTAPVLFGYQEDALRAWFGASQRGIFEMATGTGKTYTALACLDDWSKRQDRWIGVITVPYDHLATQWEREIRKYGLGRNSILLADSSHLGWQDTLANTILDMKMGHATSCIVISTNRTAVCRPFQLLTHGLEGVASTMLISDEVHTIGSRGNISALTDAFQARLGLSATPRRWLDEEGTAAVESYFGETVFEFPLSEALTTVNPMTGETYLTPFAYFPRVVHLTDDETSQYVRLTASLQHQMGSDDPQRTEAAKLLAIRRANVVKSASAKYEVLNHILQELGPHADHLLVYCVPAQFKQVQGMLREHALVAQRFTMRESAVPSRQYGGISRRDIILEEFASGRYQALVAMKCLDEGVDLPSAKTAILMASSTNPREFIQRIGRVIRRAPGKKMSTIYDLVVQPNVSELPPDVARIERRIQANEMARAADVARLAVNSANALDELYREYR